MRLTRNSIALSGNFGKIDPRIHFDVFQITLTYVRAILKDVKIDLGLFFPNCPQSHAITSTNVMVSIFIFSTKENLIVTQKDVQLQYQPNDEKLKEMK